VISTTGPWYVWPMSFAPASGVIGFAAENAAPVSVARSSDSNHGPRSIPAGLSLCRRQILRLSDVLMNCTGSGEMYRGVMVCKVNSLA
jgi:hypothetical protein